METPELASSLRWAFSKLYRRLRREMHVTDKLSVTEVTLLSNLYHKGPLYPSEMAAIVGIKAQSISQVINHLDELKLVIRTPSETDKRKVAISLSKAGQQLIEDTRHGRDKWLAEVIEQKFSPEERIVLERAIVLLERLSD